MSAIAPVMSGNIAIVPSEFDVFSKQGEYLATLHCERFMHVVVMSYVLRVWSKSVPTEENKHNRELVWVPSNEDILKLITDFEGPQTVRRSRILNDGDTQYRLFDTGPAIVQTGTGLWEILFYYENGE